MKLLPCLAATILLSCAGPTLLHAMTIASDAPCNVFVAGGTITFALSDAPGDAHYTVINYFGGEAATGEVIVKDGKGTIRREGLPLGAYEITCRAGDQSASTVFCVVADRGKTPMPRDGRVGVDAAAAWVVKPDEGRKPVAKALGLAGIPWVRERLSWSQTEPQTGRFEWGRYQETADLLSAEGIRVCQVFHDVPKRLHPTSDTYVYPTDLRDLYRYSKAAASHFKNQIQAWEVWNEADIGWTLLGDSFAGMQKAECLGIKAGNPNALVLHSSLSHITYQSLPGGGQATFARNMYDCGLGDYFDVFDWHTYLDYPEYPKMMDAYRKLMADQGISKRPAWLTEVGAAKIVPTEGPLKGYMDNKALHEQCDFLPKSVTMALVAGTERYFWFVLPSYMEGANQFGLLRPDLAANPAFGAISAAAHILGLSEYRGQIDPSNANISEYLFSTPEGNVISVWAEKETDLTVPTERARLKVADMFGKTTEVAAKDGAVTIKAGPQVQYLLDVGRSVESKAVANRPEREKLPVCKPSTVVLVGYPALGSYWESRVWQIGANCEPFVYTLEVYQFDETKPAEGEIEVVAPTGWKVEQPIRTVKLQPMGREVLKFNVTPVATGGETVKLKAIGRFTSPPVAPSVSYLR